MYRQYYIDCCMYVHIFLFIFFPSPFIIFALLFSLHLRPSFFPLPPINSQSRLRTGGAKQALSPSSLLYGVLPWQAFLSRGDFQPFPPASTRIESRPRYATRRRSLSADDSVWAFFSFCKYRQKFDPHAWDSNSSISSY